MRKELIVRFLCTVVILCFLPVLCGAQEWSSPETEQMYENGRNNLNRGNTKEAIAIFQKILPLEPGQVQIKKSLAQAFFMDGNAKNAIVVLEELMRENKADEATYRLAAQAYSGQKEERKAQKILSDGIEKYPHSGLLYYEMGMLYKQQRNFESALKYWLDGIEKDPVYHLNYQEAAIAYVQTKDVIWAILYAEIFINKEPNTQRGSDMRLLLLDAYQKFFFTPSDNAKGESLLRSRPKNFEEAVSKTLMSLFFVVSDGINTENLVMLRSRFIVSWSAEFSQRYPFSLFSMHEDMMRNGYFDAYNQWLFGKAENPQQYESWTRSFPKEIEKLQVYFKKNPLQLSNTDVYNRERNFKNMFPAFDKVPKR